MAGLKLYPKEYRHDMTHPRPAPDSSEVNSEPNCPRRPRGETNQIPAVLQEKLRRMFSHKHERGVMQATLKTYVDRVGRESFVHFPNFACAEEARQFVYFPSRLGVNRRRLECVSGNNAEGSTDQERWKAELNVQVQPRPKGGDFGPKSSISIRPTQQIRDEIVVSRSAFRFLLVMAYIVFGQELGTKGDASLKPNAEKES